MAITDLATLGVPDDAPAAQVVATLAAFAAAVSRAGADALQLRAYTLADGLLCRAAREMAASLVGGPTRLLVNERAHVAVVSGAAGVHLRATGMPAVRVRRVVGPAACVGRSVHVGDRLAPGEMEDVDYVLFGTVFASASKPPAHGAVGLDALAAYVRQVSRPVLAVGGITEARCAAVAASGAAGVAGIGLFADAWRRGGAALDDLVARMHDRFVRAEARP